MVTWMRGRNRLWCPPNLTHTHGVGSKRLVWPWTDGCSGGNSHRLETMWRCCCLSTELDKKIKMLNTKRKNGQLLPRQPDKNSFCSEKFDVSGLTGRAQVTSFKCRPALIEFVSILWLPVYKLKHSFCVDLKFHP